MIEALVQNTIEAILRDAEINDYSLLAAILEGNSGWVQYSALNDEQIALEYKETFPEE